MLLALDIGNSHVLCAIHDSKKWIHSIRIVSNLHFWDQFITLKKYKITDCAISSVVPSLTQVYLESVKNIFQIDSFIINSKNSMLELDVDSPSEVGSDRLCNTIAAKQNVGTPAIIGDIGSATNYDVVDDSGAFIGGSIAPGLETAAKNLFKKAALLNEIALIVPKLAIGKNTASNLQSGIMLGAIDIIDGMFLRIQTEMHWKNNHNIITGGFGKLISSHIKTKHIFLPTLTIDGIRIIYEQQ